MQIIFIVFAACYLHRVDTLLTKVNRFWFWEIDDEYRGVDEFDLKKLSELIIKLLFSTSLVRFFWERSR